jgi:predicted alpha/beta-fold hydrolase
MPFERERVPLSDGAVYLGIDLTSLWIYNLDWGPVFKSLDKDETKILIILHGLTGASETNYIR